MRLSTGVDIQKVDPSNEPNRPHISSDIQFSNNVEAVLPNSLASRFRPSASPLQCGPSGAPLCISASPVRWVLRLVPKTRNPFFTKTSSFLQKPDFSIKISALRKIVAMTDPSFCLKLRDSVTANFGRVSTYRLIHRHIPKTGHFGHQITSESARLIQ